MVRVRVQGRALVRAGWHRVASGSELGTGRMYSQMYCQMYGQMYGWGEVTVRERRRVARTATTRSTSHAHSCDPNARLHMPANHAKQAAQGVWGVRAIASACPTSMRGTGE